MGGAELGLAAGWVCGSVGEGEDVGACARTLAANSQAQPAMPIFIDFIKFNGILMP